MRDIFSLPKNNSDPATRQDGSDEDTPLQRLRDVYCPEDRGTSLGDTNDANGNQRVVRDNLNVLRGPVCAAGGTPERDANAKKRKSVSFEDDVIVYLFDQVLCPCRSVTLEPEGCFTSSVPPPQESPTSELHCEARTAPPDGAFGDTGTNLTGDARDFCMFVSCLTSTRAFCKKLFFPSNVRKYSTLLITVTGCLRTLRAEFINKRVVH